MRALDLMRARRPGLSATSQPGQPLLPARGPVSPARQSSERLWDGRFQQRRSAGAGRLARSVWFLAVGVGALNLLAATDEPILELSDRTTDPDSLSLAAAEMAVRSATADPARAAEVERRLLTVLQSNASVETKRFICRQFQCVGSEISAPLLGRLLTDPQLAHAARMALETMPSFAGGAALRQTLQSLRGELLVGAINSLGERREPVSVPTLHAQLASRDTAVVQAAVVALGKIGGDPALDELLAVARHYEPTLAEGVLATVNLNEEVRRRLDVTVVFDALLVCANAPAATPLSRANALFSRLYEAAPVPRPQRLAALSALTRAAPDQAAPLILKLLRGSDPEMHAVAADLVGRLPVASASPIITLLDGLPAPTQHLVLGALADRRDPALLFPLLRASMSPDPDVRRTGLKALAVQEGNLQIVRILLAYASGRTEDSLVARASLVRLHGPSVDADLAAQLEDGDAARRAEAARCLGLRGMRPPPPQLRKALNDADATVRFAALECIGRLGQEADIPLLLDHLSRSTATPEREAAARAILNAARAIAATSPPVARSAAEKASAAVDSEAIRKEAQQLLDDLDAGADPAARSPDR